MFDPAQLRAATFVRHVEIHDTLGSTNDRAAELARGADIELPALVVARRQTAGKGRGRNTWWSADGALTFSVLIDAATTGVLPTNWPQLSLATAVAVCDALAEELSVTSRQRAGSSADPAGLGDEPARCTGLGDEPALVHPQSRLGIKWPNDVFVDGRKICGILIESPGGSAPAKDRLIIGIGINVNNSWRGAPQEAGPSGTAICDVTGRPHDLPAVLARVLIAIESRIAQLRTHGTQLKYDWQRLNLLVGQTVLVESNGRRMEGECLEIAQDGALVVDSVFGQQRFYSGTVRLA